MKYIFLSISLFFLIISCGRSVETVTVESPPLEPITGPDTASGVTSPAEDDFIHLKIGETNNIESLDPLFAETNSELRITHLIYDGLAKLDESGNPEPALAKNWEVNRDSTRFTFNLRTDVFFHDVNSFSGGIGRKFTGSDVSFIFERMASILVPDFAAEMFNNIRGFNAYHNEQTFVKNAEKRVYDSIDGLDVQNDSTIVITLNQPSPDFLHKLTHPYASVYASESTTSINPPIQRPAGTGVFYYVTTDENRHILAVNNSYHGQKPDINRLDFISGLSESDLFELFVRNELDAVIEPSPSTITMVADSTGEITNSYADNYKLVQAPANSSYSLYYNESSNQESAINMFLSTLNTDNMFENPVLGSIEVHDLDTTNANEGNGGAITIAHTTHSSELYLINRVLKRAASLGFTAFLNASYAITDDVTISTRLFPNTTHILTWNTPLFILMQNNASGIQISHEPWNIDISQISVSEEI
ncbi:MAG: ABC transporter substrate-binding protein [Balneolaceae bacterium]